MDEKQIKELLRDLVNSARAAIDLIMDKALFGDDQESEMFMPVMNSMVYYNLEQAVFRALDSGMLEEKEVKVLLRDLVDSGKHMLDLIMNKAMFGDDQECEQLMPVYQSMEYDGLQRAVLRALNSGFLDKE